MARRTPKPFTVEIRNSRTRPKLTTSPGASLQDPLSAEQPWVMGWPGIDDGPKSIQQCEFVPAGVRAPTGRVLPVLNERDPLAERLASEPSPRRRGRPKKIAALVPEWPNDASAETALDLAEAEGGTPKLGESLMLVDVEGMAATMLLRRGRKRLPRPAFKAGHRWRSRLPAAVHLGSKKPGRA